ncbi:unnamed protein product [Rhodiola kirilowii]
MSGDTKFSVVCSLFNWMQKSKSSAKKRSKFRKFLDTFCKPSDYFAAIRLLLPNLDRERGTYGLKESVLATCLIDALGMSRESEDAVRLINWRKGGSKTGSNAGNFAMVAAEVLQRRQGMISGGLTINELNDFLDRLASSENRSDKTAVLSSLINRTNAQEMKWIVMIILKDLKMGISEKSIFHEFHPDAEDLFNVTCDLKLVCEKLSNRSQHHKRQDIEVGKPVRPQLAFRAANASAAWKKHAPSEKDTRPLRDSPRVSPSIRFSRRMMAIGKSTTTAPVPGGGKGKEQQVTGALKKTKVSAIASGPEGGKGKEQQGTGASEKMKGSGNAAGSEGEKSKEQAGSGAAEKSKAFWAARSAVTRNRERGVPLFHFPQTQGADRVVIPAEEWNVATSKFDHALVGFVFGTKPFLGRMKGFARVKWGDETVVRVSQLNEGIFLFKFLTEEKKAEVLCGRPWSFDNRPLILKPWSEQEEYTCGSVDALPVWIRLPRLKAHLVDSIILSRLCSRLGTPICTDGVTAEGSNFNYARVCVQIYADQDFMDCIEYEDPYGNCYVQPVEYEWRPPRCLNCFNFGHVNAKCPEPNMERMLEGLRERERRERELKDKRDMSEDEIEGDEDIAIESDPQKDDLEREESSGVPET